MPASIVRSTWIYAIAVTLAIIAAASCGASDTPQGSTPPTGTPTLDAPTQQGIGVAPETASATLVQLVDELHQPEYYRVDVPGFGASLNLRSPLTAHTCKPGADDEMFAVDRPDRGNLYMPAYDLCMEAEGTDAPARLHLRACSDSAVHGSPSIPTARSSCPARACAWRCRRPKASLPAGRATFAGAF